MKLTLGKPCSLTSGLWDSISNDFWLHLDNTVADFIETDLLDYLRTAANTIGSNLYAHLEHPYDT